MENVDDGICPVVFVDPEWAKEKLNSGDLDVIDAQPEIMDYLSGHIPGAVYLDQGLFRIPFDEQESVMIPIEMARTIIRMAGLDRDKPVLVYSSKGERSGCGDGLEHALVGYALARFGHRQVRLLNGGLDSWKASEGEVVKGQTKVEISEFEPELMSQYLIDMTELRSIMGRDDVLILDSRSPKDYEGEGPWMRPGHIPGSVNLPWKDLVIKKNLYKLKPLNTLCPILENVGVHPIKDMICTSGTFREATLEFFVLRFFHGNPRVRLYEGSYLEWASNPRNETRIGHDP